MGRRNKKRQKTNKGRSGAGTGGGVGNTGNTSSTSSGSTGGTSSSGNAGSGTGNSGNNNSGSGNNNSGSGNNNNSGNRNSGNSNRPSNNNNQVTGIGPVSSGSAYASSLSSAPNRSSLTTKPNQPGSGFQAAAVSDAPAPTGFTGINPTTSDLSRESFNFGPTVDRFGRGDDYASNINEFNMRFGETSEQRADAYENTLTGRKDLFDDATSGSGPVASGDAYARGLETSRFGSPLNTIKTGLNLIPGVDLRLQNDKELADSVGRAPDLTRRRSGGGTNRIEQQVAATEILPETAAPIGTQQPFNYIQGGTDNSQLSRIQQQSYYDNLARMMGSYGTTSSAAAGVNSQGTGRRAPQLGSFRGTRRFQMFAPKSSYMAGSGPQDLLNRGGLRITSLNT